MTGIGIPEDTGIDVVDAQEQSEEEPLVIVLDEALIDLLENVLRAAFPVGDHAYTVLDTPMNIAAGIPLPETSPSMNAMCLSSMIQ